MRWRGVFSGVVAAGLTLAVLPLGCGGDPGEVRDARNVSLLTNDWTVPEDVMAELRGCVKQHGRDLKTYAHEATFEATVIEGGSIQRIHMRKSTLQHGEMESCMMRALVSLPVPMSEVLRYSRPVAESDSMGRERGSLGIVQAIAGVALGPIIVIAAGVTLTVYVAVTLDEATLDLAKRRKKIDEICDPPFYQCLVDQRQPSWNIDDFGYEKDCGSCLEECRHKKGIWPDYKCPRPGYLPPGGRPN